MKQTEWGDQVFLLEWTLLKLSVHRLLRWVRPDSLALDSEVVFLLITKILKANWTPSKKCTKKPTSHSLQMKERSVVFKPDNQMLWHYPLIGRLSLGELQPFIITDYSKVLCGRVHIAILQLTIHSLNVFLVLKLKTQLTLRLTILLVLRISGLGIIIAVGLISGVIKTPVSAVSM